MNNESPERKLMLEAQDEAWMESRHMIEGDSLPLGKAEAMMWAWEVGFQAGWKKRGVDKED